MGPGLPSQCVEDFQDFGSVGFLAQHGAPAHLGLEEAVIGRVVIGSNEVGNAAFLEDGSEEHRFDLVFKNGDFNVSVHGEIEAG